MEGRLLGTALLYFFIIPVMGSFIIMLLKEKPKVGLFLTPVMVSAVFFGFTFYLDAGRDHYIDSEAAADITVMASALASFCLVAMSFCAHKIFVDKSRNTSSLTKDISSFPNNP